MANDLRALNIQRRRALCDGGKEQHRFRAVNDDGTILFNGRVRLGLGASKRLNNRRYL
jgi:hypothetical protein